MAVTVDPGERVAVTGGSVDHEIDVEQEYVTGLYARLDAIPERRPDPGEPGAGAERSA